MNCKIPPPVTLNCWKHHANFIKSQSDLFQKNKISRAELYKLLLIIGESQMDLYLGKLNPKQISDEIINNLRILDADNYTGYYRWLTEKGKSYKELDLSDNSVWTLRLGNEKKKYIHIHPGRYSPLTVRVRAITLKTTIALKSLAKDNYSEQMNLNSINEVRTNLLKLPPLKSISSSSGIGKFLNIFNKEVK